MEDARIRRHCVPVINTVGYTPLAASADGRTRLCPRIDGSVDDLMLVENFR
jgi:hypothetical protein